ncbi:ankyrin-3-like isoform X2 [Phymastichus coffea]|uniref:ankyrin-3-like isoform X2 n=1 Tax=Phymastichus coffea TaxID=108790 RepID=UPI00273C35F5|nr:ankyrin-3-like isoform X2 [Phymastichus coffea]
MEDQPSKPVVPLILHVDTHSPLQYDFLADNLLDKGYFVSEPESIKLSLDLANEQLSLNSDWTDIALKLLDDGAHVSERNANRDTFVHLGFVKGIEDDKLDSLIKKYLTQSKIDAVNKDGLSVLHIACTRPNVEFVRELLLKKAIVNRRVPPRSNSKFAGYTPLHIAVECGNYEVANLLLEYNADIYVPNLNRSTPLHSACYRRDQKMIDMILAHDRITANVIDNNGLSHFMVTCASNEAAFAKEHLRVVKCKSWTSMETLINSCINKAYDHPFAGYTPLHFAAEFGSGAVVELLMSCGANCCTMSARLLTPLMLADHNGHES